MSIPKKIHYCWFGGNPKPELALLCIQSWKKYCPDYEIIEWNEKNFDISTSPLYVRQAYEARKWAFVTDYVRLKVLCDYGGIYMDTDVEVVKPLNKFLKHSAFSGFEDKEHIPTGIMACEAENALFQSWLRKYDTLRFLMEDGTYNIQTNVITITNCMKAYGIRLDDTLQEVAGCVFYPHDYFCPKDYHTNRIIVTDRTHAIHHFAGSWIDSSDKELMQEYQRYINLFGKNTGNLIYQGVTHIKENGLSSLPRKIIQHSKNKRITNNMHPIKSLQARILQPFILKHYRSSHMGKALSALKDTAPCTRCFFIGNGPSLRAEDLTTLQKHNEITFAFNRIYNIFDQTDWRPTYYISQDEKMLEGCIDTVNKLPMGQKFIPVQFKWYYDLKVNGATYFNIVHQPAEAPLDFAFSDDIARGIYNASTCMYTAAQIATYMGFKEIFFIGVDHHFRISKNNQGEIVVDTTAKDYFSEKYNEDKDKLYIPNTENSTKTYIAIKHHCDKRGIQVYNATRGGKLEVFPRVNFEDLF